MLLSKTGKVRPLQLVVLALLTSSVWLSATPARGDFCDESVVHDYARPLAGLPAIPAPPLDEHLAFAPARVFLNRHESGSLQVGTGERGFLLSFGPYSASRRVNWHVTSRLVKIDRRGRPVDRPQTLARQVKRVPAETGVDLGFEISGKPAIYRLEIIFDDQSGKRLARFGEYFRVLRPSLDVDFFLNGTVFRRGERVQAWLVNRGVTYLSFGLEKTVEYWDGYSWVSPPVPFPGGIVPAIGLGIGPGVRTSCWGTTIPANATPGTYRFAKSVERSTGPRSRDSAPLNLGAEFTVTE